MADKRNTDFPLGCSVKGPFLHLLWNSFFDPAVQRVLFTRKEIDSSNLEAHSADAKNLLLAWPIIAFKEVSAMAHHALAKYWQDSMFPDFFDWDPVFIAHLLQAVTDYENVPASDWSLSRVLAECPMSYQPSKTRECIASGEIPNKGLNLQEFHDWKEISKMIAAEKFPGLKGIGSSIRAENLRKGAFYKERRRQLKVYDAWRENFSADSLVLIPDDHTDMPCIPGPNFYKKQRARIRLKNISKKVTLKK